MLEWLWHQGARRCATTPVQQTATTTTTMKMMTMMVVMMMVMVVANVEGATVNFEAERGSRRTKRSETDKAEWSVWFNSDEPWSGDGDFETSDSIKKLERICSWDREVAGAQCRVAGTNDTFDSSTAAFQKDHLLQACSSHGLICLNAQQPSGLCQDYQVRFLCQALQTDDDDNSSIFPNVDFKIYILIAAVPLLVITLRLLWTCVCKPRLKRRRQAQGRQQQRQQRNNSLDSDTLSTSSSQASIDTTLALPPPTYAELFGDNQPQPPHRAAVFSISGGECAGCGKCLHPPYVVGQGDVEGSVLPQERVRQGQGRSVSTGGDGAGASPVAASSSSSSTPERSGSGNEDVFATPPSQQAAGADVTSSQTEAKSAGPGLRPSMASSASLQGAAALPLPPPPTSPSPSTSQTPVQCTCACHRVSSAHVNLAFQWDSGDHVDASSPPPVFPGMHKPVFSFQRIGSVTSFTSYTSLPDYEEALEILKKNGLFMDEEKV